MLQGTERRKKKREKKKGGQKKQATLCTATGSLAGRGTQLVRYLPHLPATICAVTYLPFFLLLCFLGYGCCAVCAVPGEPGTRTKGCHVSVPVPEVGYLATKNKSWGWDVMANVPVNHSSNHQQLSAGNRQVGDDEMKQQSPSVRISQSRARSLPCFKKPAICGGTQRIGEIWTIKPATRLPWPFSLAECWMEAWKQARDAAVTEEAGFPRCQAAKPRFSKAAARSYGAFRTLSVQPFGSPPPDDVWLKNSFLLDDDLS
ncbi:hypothetical protein QBC45DRAFT_162357 [Copromyces sp. CBS 386.78]|nr:hypothetical protein QBC45DRAFT_162357 [Copromyces sp. CBS 386.78]